MQFPWPGCFCTREPWTLRSRSSDSFPKKKEHADLKASSLCLKALCVSVAVWFRQEKLHSAHCWAGPMGIPWSSSNSVLQKRLEDFGKHRVTSTVLSFSVPLGKTVNFFHRSLSPPFQFPLLKWEIGFSIDSSGEEYQLLWSLRSDPHVWILNPYRSCFMILAVYWYFKK